MRPCFAFSARTATTPAVLAIDEEIGFWGVQARDFRNALDALDGDELIVEINSPGGDVMAGLGMYNMLRNSGKTVTTRVTGLAASIASIIMLAGDKREMPSNAFAMVHSVQSGAWGTAEEIRAQAEVIEKIQASLRNIYVDRMGIDEAQATEIMAKDTWLTAAECLDMGFATSVVDPVTATAKFDLARAALPENVAKVFAARSDAPTPPPEPEADPAPAPAPAPAPEPAPHTPVADAIVAEAKAAGLTAHAPFLALACDSVETARVRIGQAREIVALCNVAGQADAAAEHIRAGTAVADVRRTLAEALAQGDTQIDNAPPNTASGQTSGNPAKPAVVTPTSLWASHNSQSKKGR